MEDYLVEADFIRGQWLFAASLVMMGRDLQNAFKLLNESLTRSRRVNYVEMECHILITLAHWHRAEGNVKDAYSTAEDALRIADRCEYRLQQAEIHNFLAQLALDSQNKPLAREHAVIAKERAWCDGPPHCYKPALDEADGMLEQLEVEV